ncbi:MAG: DUF6089 family protein [Prevotella sp.]|jgi:hypothetical protein
MRRLLFSMMLLIFTAATAGAQEDPIYRMEIGVEGGMSGYLGDFNGNLTKDLQPAGGIVVRRLFNPYIGLNLSGFYGKLKGSSEDVETYYPDQQEQPYEFDNTLVDVSLTFEYNFWPYGTGRDYRGAKRITPYIFGGIGATYVSGGEKNKFTGNVPIGLGVKYKISPRLNLGLNWAMHFSLNDELDGMKDPSHVESSGAFKNTDCYSALMLSLTYSFSAKCTTCNKDFY